MNSQKRILAIDPGNTHSAAVVISAGQIHSKMYLPNDAFLSWLVPEALAADIVCVEMVASMGMAVGATIFETCVFIGRIMQLCPTAQRITRVQVKTSICHSARAKDANVRQALIDFWGPQGSKKAPGPTYGISGDMWAALAVGTALLGEHKLYQTPT